MEQIETASRVFTRLCNFIYFLILFLIKAFWLHLTVKSPVERKRTFLANGRYYVARCCHSFGMEIKVKNLPPPEVTGLVVGNHMGFVDIMVMCTVLPSLFVTSQDMRETPLLGLLTELGGCLYVDRKSRVNIMNELKEIIEYLKLGFRVTIYPEATSHNGEEILPFKRTLLTSAAHAGVPILPYVFNFVSLNGEPFSKKNRDSVCWYGDISFARSLLNLLALKTLVCEVEFLDPVYSKPDDDRAKVADYVREKIVEKFRPAR